LHMKDNLLWAKICMIITEILGKSDFRDLPPLFLSIILFSLSTASAQNPVSSWVDLEEVDLSTLKINTSGNFSQNGFYFIAVWDKNMGIMENQQGNYSGISSLKVYNWKRELINS